VIVQCTVSIDQLRVGDRARCIGGYAWNVDKTTDMVQLFDFEGLLIDKDDEDFFFLTNSGRVLWIFDHHGSPTVWDVLGG
jgi:hypothetical protein